MQAEFVDPRDYVWKYNLDTFAHHASNGEWLPYRHLLYIINRISESIQRGGYRGIINMPPRHGKSETFSKWLPTWYLDHNPAKKVFATAYGESLAADFGMRVRDELRRIDGSWTNVRADKDKASDWQTPEGGGMRTSSIGGKATGFGGHLLICDDPVKNWEEAMSATYRKRVIDWFRSTFMTRLEPNASVLVIMTRWHEDDLTGYLLREHPGEWDHMVLRAIAEEDDPLGRKNGAALCPERYDEQALDRIRKGLGEHMFAGIYQQRPAPAQGALVKREWIHHYQIPPHTISTIIASWDMSFKESGHSFTVGQIWGIDGANRYLLDQVRVRADFARILHEVQALQAKWSRCTKLLIEDAANGTAIISALRNKIPGVVPIRATASKASRLQAVLPMFEAGNVWFPPIELQWVQDLVEEVVGFPNAANDDQVDAMSMALNNSTIASFTTNLDFGTALTQVNEWSEWNVV